MQRVLVFGVLVTTLLIFYPIHSTSAGQSQQSFTPTFESTECPFKIPMGETATCGYFTVPEDRSIDPDSEDFRTIRLMVAHFQSHISDPPDDPILYLVGGPGVSIFKEIDSSFYHFARLLDNRDVIVFDQRGIGYSEPVLDCPEPEDDDFLIRAISECRTELEDQGINVSAYNTSESAADIADLRITLDIDEWNIVGVSYGSRLALAVMRDNDTGVRSVVIDSVLPIDNEDWFQVDADFEIMDTIFEDCAADEACNAAYPDLEAAYDEALNNLRDNPVQGQDHFNFQFRVYSLLDDASTVQIIPAFIYGVYEDPQHILDPLAIQSGYHIYSGMQMSVNCADGIIGRVICNTWDVEFNRAAARRTVDSDVPTLLLNGAYDSITPTYGAEQTHQLLSNSTFFEIPFTAHGVIRSKDECPRSIAFEFLNDPDTPPDGNCIADMQARFVIAE